MTSYDGQEITYDELGNSLSYRGMAFTWENARELASITKDGVTYQYRYNQDGMRNRKYLSDGTVYYQTEGDLIVGEQKIQTGETEPEYEMEFIYDSSGNVIALLYNGTEFYYEKKLQGDIVAIRNVFGELSVTYEYDSWGNVTAIGGLSSDRTRGELNTFRYRGYYYDSETGLYYLNSRFYDSEVGRFINADNTDILVVQDDLYDKNLYAYCDNNPINRFDKDGDIWTELALANGTSEILAYGISMSVLKSAIISSASVILPVAVIAVVTVSVVTISVSYAKSKNNQKKNSKNGKKARDSSKNEQHGDNGRAMEKAQKQVQELREQQAKAKSKAEKKKIQIKIQNILETARKNGNGENHSQRAKR